MESFFLLTNAPLRELGTAWAEKWTFAIQEILSGKFILLWYPEYLNKVTFSSLNCDALKRKCLEAWINVKRTSAAGIISLYVCIFASGRAMRAIYAILKFFASRKVWKSNKFVCIFYLHTNCRQPHTFQQIILLQSCFHSVLNRKIEALSSITSFFNTFIAA